MKNYYDEKEWPNVLGAAFDMLEALDNLENDDGQIPMHAWKKIQKAINIAKNKPSENPCVTIEVVTSEGEKATMYGY